MRVVIFIRLVISPFAHPESLPDFDVRVVDVGQGLCVVGSSRASKSLFVYDAGRHDNQNCYEYLVTKVQLGYNLKTIIFSHSDADHIGNGANIINSFKPEIIVVSGSSRWDTKTWRLLNDSISKSVKEENSTLFNYHSKLPFPKIHFSEKSYIEFDHNCKSKFR